MHVSTDCPNVVFEDKSDRRAQLITESGDVHFLTSTDGLVARDDNCTGINIIFGRHNCQLYSLYAIY